VLEVIADVADDLLLDEWRRRVARARERLGWRLTDTVARVHRPGASLAMSAPCDQLFVATEVNEWALCSALLAQDPDRWHDLQEVLIRTALEDAEDPQAVVPPVLEESAAFARFERLAAAERRPALQPLIQTATARDLQYVLDDDFLTLGAGTGGVDFSVDDLPAVADVAWDPVHDIPTALVTGSNGKTTTVRILAACSRAHGWHVAYSSTDGVYFDGEAVATGDYSGPAGGRMAVRDRRAQAAILETARGGILRRGIAVSRAQVALVTNVSSDHFGEYGIFDLDGLADVKLSVAAVVAPGGLLVLNADDSLLRTKVSGLAVRYGRCPPLGWFALDADAEPLQEHRSAGGSTCGVRGGRLCCYHDGSEHDLGPVAAMPLTVDGSATYNIANLAGAALAAVAMGIAPTTVASVFASFGAQASDNLGRMMRFNIDGVRVVLDYAHNADGLRGLLRVAEHLRGTGSGSCDTATDALGAAGTDAPGGSGTGGPGTGGPGTGGPSTGGPSTGGSGTGGPSTGGPGTRGRLALLLGHAGNRQNDDIEDLARIAAEFKPDLVVVKENEGHLRGREQGEVPRIIRAALLRAGLPESAVPLRMSEVEAARCALDWSRPGDVVLLLMHSAAARAEVLAMLEATRDG
jgi:UDP-N-acetylmuramyl tripeptide synthase